MSPARAAILRAGELAWEGARNLMRHRLRSTLTLLGVVFGVGAVITMLGIGEGAQRTVLRDLEGMGLRNIIVDSVPVAAGGRGGTRPGSRRGMSLLQYGLVARDMDQLQAIFPDAEFLDAAWVRQRVYTRGERQEAQVLGAPPAYFAFFQTTLLEGRLFNSLDDDEGRRVALVGERLAADLQAMGGALRGLIRIGAHEFEWLGTVRLPGDDTGNLVFIPRRTAQRLFGSTVLKQETGSTELSRNEIGRLIVRLRDETQVAEGARIVETLLRRTHPSGDYRVTVPLELLRSKQRTQRVLNMVLLSIAAISLLIGGIGIMNIMLAVVTERIPEIGIRRAIGAARRDILLQFLAETVVLSSAGGLLGCALGALAVPLASQWTGWAGVITGRSVLLALAVSWLVGVVFGMAPAVRAARLDPVECLRYE